MMDNKFTELIKQWLETPSDQRDYSVGALYLLKLSGNQIMYRNIVAQLDRRHDFVDYQIQKYYNFRVQALTHAQVEEMQQQVDVIVAEHISLADCADLVVIAPATANTIAKIRYGIADNLLTATVLATKAPIVVAPVMNTGMLENPVTQENIAALKARGVKIVDPDSGELACGATGKGRMPEASEIFECCLGL